MATDVPPALSSSTPLEGAQDAAAIPRAPPLSSDELVQLLTEFEIEDTVEQIEAGDFKRIALQIPDDLLHSAVPLFRALRQRLSLDRELYVLADTTYGSCCVDEVAASHVDADLVIHYGHACLSRTSRLPVLYVLGRRPIDVEHAVASLVEAARDHLSEQLVTLVCDVAYSWKGRSIADALQSRLPDARVAFVPTRRSHHLEKGKQHAHSSIACAGQSCPCRPRDPDPLPPDADADAGPADPTAPSTILYIGPESLALNNLLFSHSSASIFGYSPETRTARLESARTNRILMRRYAVVQRAKDADVFGLVVGTLGVASYLPLLDRLRAVLRRHRKKVYTLAVGKLNPAKLANYLEIECFVLVACPENSLIEGAKDFLRPIVTPFELEVALGEREWASGPYELDFERLLAGQLTTVPDRVEDDDDAPVFSAATGKLRTPKRYGQGADASLAVGSALALRADKLEVATAMDSAAGQHLAGRSYVGLDPRYGVDAPAAMETGRTGIAREYGDDHA